jgi:hypothetical protein
VAELRLHGMLVRCSTRVRAPFYWVGRRVEVARICEAVAVNGILTGGITGVEGSDYSELKRGRSY